MRLATVRLGGATRAVRVEDGPDGAPSLVDLGFDDVGELLAEPDWHELAGVSGEALTTHEIDYAPLVSKPSKVICVGHNYANHIAEMGRETPAYPTLFTKFADSLLGANDDIVKPPETEALDWEVELVVVIGRGPGAPTLRRASETQAEAAIAGFTVMNDISVRDWQFRTVEWSQGKIWDSSTPVGPVLVTPDEVGGVRPDLEVRTSVDGHLMQRDRTGTLIFDPVHLVRYVSTVVRLRPGDLIATGTPAGVGHARTEPVYLQPGSTVVTEIERIGSCVNRVVA